ncbi:MAG: helix-turn-helix domain-containing protein [Treponemataceae bacterium]|nr:helix-turn-helix domain-containing protein [Treponemataceae bacterium]
MEGIRKIFGRNVQKYRQLRNWSQAELAKKIDISTAFMMHIEHGTRGASMETIELLARCFEIPYKALFEETAEAKTNYAQVLFALEDALKERLNA